MENQEYSKGRLSEDYFKLCKKRYFPSGFYPKIYSIIKWKIAKVEEKIRAVYEKDGNLKKLGTEGIGRKTEKELELILKKGIKGALETVDVKNVKRLEERQYNFIPEASKFRLPQELGDFDPLLGGAVRELREGIVEWKVK